MRFMTPFVTPVCWTVSMSEPRRWTIAMDNFGIFTVKGYRGEIINPILGEIEVIEAEPVEAQIAELKDELERLSGYFGKVASEVAGRWV